jgi:hypothetical protein
MASTDIGRYRGRRTSRQLECTRSIQTRRRHWRLRTLASFLGIDLSKETFHALLLSDRGEAKRVFPNTSKGFEQLTAWLKNRHAADVHICMEATGA